MSEELQPTDRPLREPPRPALPSPGRMAVEPAWVRTIRRAVDAALDVADDLADLLAVAVDRARGPRR